ncbi:MAG: hypothetical protein U9O94_10710 [Nanoarchaeota archaeon]|nr:hypothetical protein [Nanoarchaeota archaeon]
MGNKKGVVMSKDKFQKIKINAKKKYLVHYRVPVAAGLAWIYEYGKDIKLIRGKYLKLKKWMFKKIHHRHIIQILEV